MLHKGYEIFISPDTKNTVRLSIFKIVLSPSGKPVDYQKVLDTIIDARVVNPYTHAIEYIDTLES